MIIYKVTNVKNGMVYIGQTKRSLKARWMQHCNDANSRIHLHKLQKDIKQFGAESFRVEQIDTAENEEEALKKEAFWIKHFDSAETGYNVSPGGKGGGHRKKVMAVESGMVFGTIVEAAKFFGVNYSGISFVVDKPHLRAAGQHWISV